MAPPPVAAAGLLVTFLLLGAAYLFAVPMFETPDEPSHLEYIAFVSATSRLPVYGARPEVPGEGIQPPFSYVLSVPLFRALVGRSRMLLDELHRLNLSMYDYDAEAVGANELLYHSSLRLRPPYYFTPKAEVAYLRHMRWPSLAFGAVALICTYLACLRLFTDPAIPILVAGLLGLNPQFLFRSACVSNDAAAAAIGAGLFLVVAAALTDPAGVRRSHYLWAALLAAVGLLTKISLLVGALVAITTVSCVDRRGLRARVMDTGLGSAAALLLVAPYLAWNLEHHGDLTGMRAFWQTAAQLTAHDEFGGLVRYFTGMYWRWTFESYWSRFGWLNVYPPTWVYLAFLTLTGAGVLGFARSAYASRHQAGHLPALRLYLSATILATIATHIYLNVRVPQPQGRHLLPVAPEIACLLAMGIVWWTSSGQPRASWRTTAWVLGALFGLAVFCLLQVIVPAYALGVRS